MIDFFHLIYDFYCKEGWMIDSGVYNRLYSLLPYMRTFCKQPKKSGFRPPLILKCTFYKSLQQVKNEILKGSSKKLIGNCKEVLSSKHSEIYIKFW